MSNESRGWNPRITGLLAAHLPIGARQNRQPGRHTNTGIEKLNYLPPTCARDACVVSYPRGILAWLPRGRIKFNAAWQGAARRGVARAPMEQTLVGIKGENMITIDQEFRKLIPPLTPDERAQLEANLRIEGCRDPLVIWQHDGQEILLDGHNRKEICEQYSIPYETVLVNCPIEDRLDAEIWILKNQMGRRNLDAGPRAALGVRLEKRLAEAAKRRQKEAGKIGADITNKKIERGTANVQYPGSDSGTAAKQAADLVGVSERSIYKAKKVEQQAPEVFDAMAAGDLSVSAAKKISDMPEEERQEAIQEARKHGGRTWQGIKPRKHREHDLEVERFLSGISDLGDMPEAVEMLERIQWTNEIFNASKRSEKWLHELNNLNLQKQSL